VNNSATLVLTSTDQDGFGEKIVTGSNFTKKDGTTTPVVSNYDDSLRVSITPLKPKVQVT